MRKAIEEAKKFVCTTKDRIVKDAKEFIQNVDWKKVASGAFMWGAIGGAVGGGTTEVFKDVGSNVLGKVGKKLVEDGADMALDLTQTATENGGLTGKDVLFSAVTSFGGDLVGAAKTNSTARNQLIDGATDNRAIKDAVGDSVSDASKNTTKYIDTPYGKAFQENSEEALRVKNMLKMEKIYIEEDLLVDPTLQMHNFGHLKVLCPLDMLINTELILKIPIML